MKIDVNELGCIVLEEVYRGLTLRTKEGRELNLAMRDEDIEMSIEGEAGTYTYFRVCMYEG